MSQAIEEVRSAGLCLSKAEQGLAVCTYSILIIRFLYCRDRHVAVKVQVQNPMQTQNGDDVLGAACKPPVAGVESTRLLVAFLDVH